MSFQQYNDFTQQQQQQQQQQGGSSSPTGGNPPAGQAVTQPGQPSASPAPYNNGNGPPPGNGNAADGSKTTLWYVPLNCVRNHPQLPPKRHSITDMFVPSRMGELEPWIDENFVRNVWFQLGENVNVKMIRDKFSGYVSKESHAHTRAPTHSLTHPHLACCG